MLPSDVRSPLPSVDRLAFETLISDTSARLMQSTPSQVPAAIEAALLDVRLFFKSDRCGLLTVSVDQQVCNVYCASYADAVMHVSGEINLVQLYPWAGPQLLAGQPVQIAYLSDLPPEAAMDRAHLEALGVQSQLTVPIVLGTRVTHMIVVHHVAEEAEYPTEIVSRLRVLGELIASTLQRKEAFDALAAANDELQQLRARLERENICLRKQVSHMPDIDLVTGRSPAIRAALAMAEQVAATTSTVLLVGETGTGKERFAEFIHRASSRGQHHMVRVNCSAIPSALIESELFGREKGAYTGALSKQIGRFELAQGSTIFLDEIGDLTMDVQVKLLRVLQDHTIERLGSPTPVAVDVRVIAATNRDLEAAVRAGTFRADLYYRLNVFPIVIPPLRERREDIPALVDVLIRELGGIVGRRVKGMERASLEALSHYTWPGNVRELRNVLERAMILSKGPTLTVALPQAARVEGEPIPAASGGGGLYAVERKHILGVLHQTGWRIRGKNGAAEHLGLKPTTLEDKMARLGIRRPTV